MIRFTKSVGLFGILAMVGAAGCALDGSSDATSSPAVETNVEGQAFARGTALTVRLPSSFRGAAGDVRLTRARINDAGDGVVFENVVVAARASAQPGVVEISTTAALDEGEVLTLTSASNDFEPSTLRVHAVAASAAGTGTTTTKDFVMPDIPINLPQLMMWRLLSLKDDDGRTLTDGKTIQRDVKWIDATFGGLTATEKLDCAAIALARSTFELYSAEPTSDRQQAMYHNSAAPRVGDTGYRGSLECDASKNRLRFNVPGNLLGGAVIKLNLGAVKSTQGRATDKSILTFTTLNPGIKIQMKRVESNLGMYDSAPFWHPDRRDADLYLSMWAATVNQNEKIVTSDNDSFMTSEVVKKIPTGFSDWPNLNQGENRIPDQEIIFFTPQPVGQNLAFYFNARDKDGSGTAQKAAEFVRNTHDQAATVLAAFGQAPYAVMAKEGKKTWTDILGLLTSNGDDHLGTSLFMFDKQDDRWGFDWKPTTDVERQYGRGYTIHCKKGSVTLRMTSEEYPRSW